MQAIADPLHVVGGIFKVVGGIFKMAQNSLTVNPKLEGGKLFSGNYASGTGRSASSTILDSAPS
jgi:hypothetical protein